MFNNDYKKTPDSTWFGIENEELLKFREERERQRKIRKEDQKVNMDVNLTPIQRKHQELLMIYNDKYGGNNSCHESQMLLDDLRAFERVLEIMK